MICLFLALAVWSAGGVLALVAGRGRHASAVGALAAVAGGVLAVVPALQVLAGGPAIVWRHDWAIPFGSLHVGIDPLAAAFILPVAVLTALAALYGVGYWKHDADRKHLGAAWFLLDGLAAALVLVVTARNGLLLLVAWEAMSLLSFFLVLYDHQEESTRRAGWIYLLASHLGTACLLALFALWGGAGVWDFERLAGDGGGRADMLFLLAVIGFGTKAGLVPLHVWLPEAHPAAPSHVSAVMSGALIKMGIYGLLRTMTFLGPPPAWWGGLLIAVGAVSALAGALFALAQHDLKRLLAYCSVENVGIIALGMGLGLLGLSRGNGAMAALGLAGALLHVWNHALFKGLLFLGAGAVAHATGTRRMDQLGGLLRRMPVTGSCFVLGSAAICGLPPLNGFVGELLIYLGGFHGLLDRADGPSAAVAGVLVIGALALAGGLAAIGFAKACGATFLGEPRSEAAAAAHEPDWSMRLPLVLLALACGAIGLLGPQALALAAPAVHQLLPAGSAAGAAEGLAWAGRVLTGASYGAVSLVVLIGVLALVRKLLLARREVSAAGTWDCGYIAPTPQMEYTGSSFVQPVVDLFRMALRSRREVTPPEGLFPARAALTTETPDLAQRRFYAPVAGLIHRVSLALHALQQGRIQWYVLYIAIVLVVLLVWKLD